jgi:CHAT domain-containing protein
VSLWSVSAAATRDLMVGFYRHLIADRLPKAEALRRAKLEMLGGTAELFRHPFCWAAFVMYGE